MTKIFTHLKRLPPVMAALSIFAQACGGGGDENLPIYTPGKPIPGFVLKGRSSFAVSTGPTFVQNGFLSSGFATSASGTQPVSVINAPSTRFMLDKSGFAVPAIGNAMLDFGNIKVSDLFDNNLKVCGNNGHQQCGTALIRVYTTDASGAGLWNDDDQYGAPLSAQYGNDPAKALGLDSSNAALMQTYMIPHNMHVLRLSDFAPSLQYNFKSDFSLAGAGTYSTTIVVEYGLAP